MYKNGEVPLAVPEVIVTAPLTVAELVLTMENEIRSPSAKLEIVNVSKIVIAEFTDRLCGPLVPVPVAQSKVYAAAKAGEFANSNANRANSTLDMSAKYRYGSNFPITSPPHLNQLNSVHWLKRIIYFFRLEEQRRDTVRTLQTK